LAIKSGQYEMCGRVIPFRSQGFDCGMTGFIFSSQIFQRMGQITIDDRIRLSGGNQALLDFQCLIVFALICVQVSQGFTGLTRAGLAVAAGRFHQAPFGLFHIPPVTRYTWPSDNSALQVL